MPSLWRHVEGINPTGIENSQVTIGWFPNDMPESIMQTIQDDSQRDLDPAIVLEIRGS